MMKKLLTVLLSAALIMTTSCGDANFSLTKDQKVTQTTGDLKLNYALGDLIKLGKYKGIELYKPKSVIEDEKSVNIKMMTDAGSFKNNKFTADKKAVVKDGDIVNIDFEGFVDGAEKSSDNTTAKGFVLGIGSGAFIPGFEEQLIGHHVGDKGFDVNVTFPEDYHAADMAGKPARFVININGILTDKDVAENTDVKTIGEWREKLRKEMVEELDQKAAQNLKKDAISGVAKFSMVRRFPDKLVEDTKKDLDEYLYKPFAESMNITLEELKEQYGLTDEVITENAKNTVMMRMIIIGIAKKEKIKVTAEEFAEEKKNMIGEGKAFADEKAFDEAKADDTVIDNILQKKVSDFIVENADIKEVTQEEYDNMVKNGKIEPSDEDDEEDSDSEDEDIEVDESDSEGDEETNEDVTQDDKADTKDKN